MLHIKTLLLTVIPLHFIVFGELGRYIAYVKLTTKGSIK